MTSSSISSLPSFYGSFLHETQSINDKVRRNTFIIVIVGDVVLVEDTDTPRHRLQLGAVTEHISLHM